MLKSNKINKFIWVCDISQNTGEGRLAHLFLNIKKIKINKYSKHKINNKIFSHKYVLPLVGVFFCWYNFLKKKKIYYVNYLPLWNFLIFLLLPPKTIIGPVTGGAYYRSSIIRKYIFPILYSISQIIIYFRFNHINFATSLLKKNLFFFIKKKSGFNFVLYALKKKIKNKKKKIDFLIYYRDHLNKKSLFPYSLIKKIILLNFSVYVVGDNLNLKGVKNLGKLANQKIDKYLANTKFSIASEENPLSFFTLECINNHVKILIGNKKKIEVKNLKKNFIKINTNSNNLNYLLKILT
jgi:hypothetical protein